MVRISAKHLDCTVRERCIICLHTTHLAWLCLSYLESPFADMIRQSFLTPVWLCNNLQSY